MGAYYECWHSAQISMTGSELNQVSIACYGGEQGGPDPNTGSCRACRYLRLCGGIVLSPQLIFRKSGSWFNIVKPLLGNRLLLKTASLGQFLA